MQIETVELQPVLGLFHRRHGALDEGPEARAVVHFLEVRDLVRRDVVEDVRRRENKPPREREHGRRGAGAPAGCLVAHNDALRSDVEAARVVDDARIEITARFLEQPVAQAARGVLVAPADLQLGNPGAGRAPLNDATRVALAAEC